MISGRKEPKKQAVVYLDRLQDNYKSLFYAPPQKSTFSEADIERIEQEWGYKLPKPYIDFLQCYRLPEHLIVSASFCGNYAATYEEDDLFATLEVEWHTALGGDVSYFLSSVQKEDVALGGDGDSFLDAGLLMIAEFEGYIVFLDLVSGEVVHIYHEEIYDMIFVDGVDATDYEAVRDYLSCRVLCRDFYDFLRLVCTKEIYDEDDLKFKTIAELEKEEAEYHQPTPEELLNTEIEIKEGAIQEMMVKEHMSREEAIESLADLLQISVEEVNRGLK